MLNYQFHSGSDIDNYVCHINKVLSSALKVSSHRETISKKHASSHEIELLVKEKRQLRREWQMHRSPLSKFKLKEAARRLKQALKKDDEEKTTHILENLSPVQTNNLSLWKMCKKISTPIEGESPLRTETGSWARSDEEKAKILARHLKYVFRPHSNPERYFPPLSNECSRHVDLHITPSEALKVLEELNANKAPGYDKINPKMLKLLPCIAVKNLVRLFNAIIRIGYFPTAWKTSVIQMIAKPGKDKTLCSSYRPISLLPCLSKLFERLFLLKINVFIQENHLIPNHQFGFQAKHGTIEQVNRLTSEIRRSFENKLYCSAIFLDVAQAFDRVWHDGLIHKIKFLLPENTHKVLNSYITNRFFKVKYKSYVTSEHEINAGVPQGSVLGPLLYVLYTSDIPTSSGILTSTFADDTALLCARRCPLEASSILQSHLKLVETWLSKWRIKVNEQKSKHITFTLRQNTCQEIKLNGIRIPQSTDVTYLGIHLDRRLTWRNHILSRRTQANLKMHSLSFLLNHRSKLSLDNKIRIYNSMIKPVLIYGIQLWGKACATNIHVIQRTQSRMLRMITGAPWYVRNEDLHRDLKIPLITSEITRYLESYKNKLIRHPNALARALCRNSAQSRLSRIDLPPLLS